MQTLVIAQYKGGFPLKLIVAKDFFSRIVWYGVGMLNLCLRPRKCEGELLVEEKPRRFGTFSSFLLITRKRSIICK